MAGTIEQMLDELFDEPTIVGDVYGDSVIEPRGRPTRESKDASGHEHAADGKFGTGGTKKSKDAKDAKPKQGERAASANAKYQELIAQAKQHRIEAFNAVKADAEEAIEKASEHAGGIKDHVDQFAWDTSDDDQEPFTELESLVHDYDEDWGPADKFSHLKEIEEKAKEAIAVSQPSQDEDYAQKEAWEGEAIQAANAIGNAAARGKLKKEEIAKLVEEANAKLSPDNPHVIIQTSSGAPMPEMNEHELPKGFTPEDIASNKKHLGEVIKKAREARKHLKAYVQHRKEMQTIKSGELTESRELMVDDGANVDWVRLLESFDESKVKRDGGKFAKTASSGKSKTIDTPKGDDKPSEPAKSESSKPKSGSKSSAVAAIAGAIGVGTAAYHTIHEAGSEVFHSLPEPVQAVVTKSIAVAFSGWTASQSLAERISKEKGSTPEEADKLRSTLAAWDLVAFKPMSIATAPLGGAIAAATWVIPPVTGAYLLHSTVRHPMATFRAVKGLVSDAVGKAKNFLDAHTQTLESKMDDRTAQMLSDAIEKHNYDDWFVAILHAAIEQTKDAAKAIELAELILADHPENTAEPQDDDADVLFAAKKDGE